MLLLRSCWENDDAVLAEPVAAMLRVVDVLLLGYVDSPDLFVRLAPALIKLLTDVAANKCKCTDVCRGTPQAAVLIAHGPFVCIGLPHQLVGALVKHVLLISRATLCKT